MKKLKLSKTMITTRITRSASKTGVVALILLLGLTLMGTSCGSIAISSENETLEETPEVTVIAETITTESETSRLIIASDILENANDAILEELKEMYPDLEIITTDFNYNEYAIAIQDNSENTKTPTIFNAHIQNIVELGKNGNIADITDILEEKGWLDQMNVSIKTFVTDNNGKVYGIPVTPSYSLGLMCNVEMFKAAGLVDETGSPIIPKTWQELAETAVKIKEATGEAGFCFLGQDNSGPWHFTNIAWNFGSGDLCIKNDDGTYTANLASKGAIAAMEYIKSLKWDYGVLTENPAEENFSTGYEHIGNGTAAMCLSANDVLSFPVTYGLAPENIALGAIPAGTAGNQYSYYTGSAVVFSSDATAEEIEVVLSLIEMMGMAPVLNDAAKSRIDTTITSNASLNAPVINTISMWNNTELAEYEQNVISENANTNPALYESYFNAINTPGCLKVDTTVSASEMYSALTEVLQEVLTNPEADVTELMKEANSAYQTALDS